MWGHSHTHIHTHTLFLLTSLLSFTQHSVICSYLCWPPKGCLPLWRSIFSHFLAREGNKQWSFLVDCDKQSPLRISSQNTFVCLSNPAASSASSCCKDTSNTASLVKPILVLPARVSGARIVDTAGKFTKQLHHSCTCYFSANTCVLFNNQPQSSLTGTISTGIMISTNTASFLLVLF